MWGRIKAPGLPKQADAGLQVAEFSAPNKSLSHLKQHIVPLCCLLTLICARRERRLRMASALLVRPAAGAPATTVAIVPLTVAIIVFCQCLRRASAQCDSYETVIHNIS